MEPPYINDRKVRLIGIPLLSILLAIVMNKEVFTGGNAKDIFYWVSSCFMNTFLIWEGNRAMFILMRKKFPHYRQTARRLIWQTLVGLIYTLVVSAFIDYFFCSNISNFDRINEVLIGFKISLIPTIIVTLMYESAFFFQSWKSHVQKTEALARENVQSQLDALKNQLDPHFLFNSLNTLASLIDDENSPAQNYLDKLSDVYRYVLVSREKNTVTLEEEMQFLDAYIYLNKIRFRENLQVETQLMNDTSQLHVAPLSIQMLIENAIKHNVVSKEKPLKIRIVQEDGFLTVENNLQEKMTFEKATKVGLQNIINRYRLLTEQQVEILRNEWSFKVKLPLLEA